MSITLETVLGAAKPVDPDNVIINRVENIEHPEAGGTLLTANLAGNIGQEEETKYVVIDRPENLLQILQVTYFEGVWNMASEYVRGLEDHNNTEIQEIDGRVANWEKNNQKKTEEWELKEKRKTEEWELGEVERLEEYHLEEEMRQDDAERAATSFPGLIFDALGSMGKHVGAFRTQYAKNGGYLFNLSINNLKILVSREGVTDEDVLDDIDASLRDNKHNVKDSTKVALVEKLGLVLPRIVPLDPLPPYEPMPKPESEPKPTPDPHPEIDILEVPPLLDELNAVIMSPYIGQTFEGLSFTQHAWNAVGINPQDVQDNIREEVIPLADKHLLVRIVGKSENKSGNINLVKIISNAPSVLRPYLKSVAELAYDAHVIAGIIYTEVMKYFEQVEEGRNIINNIGDEKEPFLKIAVVEEMLERSSSMINIMFPNWYAVVKGDELPYTARVFRENHARVVGEVMSLNQEWYASNVTHSELEQYKAIAKDIVPKIMGRFNPENYSAISDDGKIEQHINDLGEVIDVVRRLINAVPKEFYELIEAKDNERFSNDIKDQYRKTDQTGTQIKASGRLMYTMRLELGERFDAQLPELTATLGRYIMKDIRKWKTEFDPTQLPEAVFKYSIGTTIDNPDFVANPS